MSKIELFKHNEKAYLAAEEMLSELGKTAVIHPTGTGKSFVAFKLCEAHKDSRVVWLSPSDYIFKSQLRNLEKLGFDIPQNIEFYTYSKLLYMTEEIMQSIKCDYIILDEFHRCGATEWEKALMRFLKLHSEAKILGLTATNVRYLDGARDMADELFDGNVCSYISLGEAIALGILPAPIYIAGLYNYNSELEKYEKIVKAAKYSNVKTAAQIIIDELKRTLENADGLDRLFEKYMPEKHGKYIAFCADVEHISEMIEHVPEWFGKVDKAPHIYTMYSDNSESDEQFKAFTEDNSDHLKLLFCIDMLNEGVHAEDLSGVILFRPTVSPIVYKQQIGRALSCGKSKTPIIFDVINNFDNLYSCDALRQEMETAIGYYIEHGEGGRIINERFEIIGEVRKCAELFSQLNDTLSASWETMYEKAAEYYNENGNLEVEKKYKTADGYSLGVWVHLQRAIRNGVTNGSLTADRIARLDKIGMRWEYIDDINFDARYAAAKKYFEQNGNLSVPIDFVTDEGITLGKWISYLRTCRKSGVNQGLLTAKRVEMLDKIGMIWVTSDYFFDRNFKAALEFYNDNDHLNVPIDYVTTDGIKLGGWITNLRQFYKKGKLSEDKIKRLEQIGMNWDGINGVKWENGFAHAREYFLEHGDLDVPIRYVCEDGYNLGTWVVNQRMNKKLSEQRIARLDKIGMIWQREDSWKVRFEMAKHYYELHGNLEIPSDYCENGIWLGRWLYTQRLAMKGKKGEKPLTKKQIEMLKSIGFSEESPLVRNWEICYAEAEKFYNANGHLNITTRHVTADGVKIGQWLYSQKKMLRAGKLSNEQIERLKRLGITSDYRSGNSEQNLRRNTK